MQKGTFPSPAGTSPLTGDPAAAGETLARPRWSMAALQAFFDQAPFYAGVLSPDGRVTDAGRMALEACGYTRDDVLGRLFWETPWWRGSAQVRARIQAALEDCRRGQRFEALLPYLTADGSERWVEFSLSPVLEQGALGFVIALGSDVTPRVQAEQELAAVRKRLDSALLAVGIGTYEWDVANDRMHCDQTVQQLFGVVLDGSGRTPLSAFVAVIHPEDRERVMARVAHSVATGENFEEDYRIVVPGAPERWVNSRGRMSKDATGQVVNFFGTVLDITRRKHAEQEREAIAVRLRRLTAIHETVLSATNDFAYVFNREGRFLYANRPLLKVYGRPLEDVVGKSLHQLGYPQWHVEMHLREIAQVIATRQPIQGEVPFRGESGISGIYDYIFTPVFGADGSVEAVAGTTRDVTERKRREARDRLLVELDDAVRPLTDPAAITQAVARLLCESLGANRCAYADVEDDENTFNLTGDFNRDVPSMVGRYRFSQFGEDCLRLVRAGEPFVVTDVESDPRLEGVRDTYRGAAVRAMICVPLRKTGRLVAAMAVQQNAMRTWLPSDIETVQVVASRSWESIERSRVVRVLADNEQRLRLAMAEAVRASRAKDDFLATLSHELRTPLNPVLLLASEAALDPALNADTRSTFEVIRKNVELEARLIDDLLDLTAVSRGKLTLRRETCDLHAVLRDAIETVKSESELKGLALGLDLAAPHATVFVDRVRFLQVFTNLLKNAAKFTPARGTITVHTAHDAAGALSIRVADTGIGLTVTELGRVFQAFEQGDHATERGSPRFGGLGLGLAIARQLVELHGGQLEASSEGRGRGAVFTVTVPLPNAVPAPLSPPPAPTPSAVGRTGHEGRRILVVEDHEPTRQALKHLLQRRSYVVETAASLAQARELARAGTFHLVLSDIGLPDGDGASLMAELRDRYGLLGVALTGYGMEDDIKRCRAAGFVTHLTKPIRVEALDAALRDSLEDEGANRG